MSARTVLSKYTGTCENMTVIELFTLLQTLMQCCSHQIYRNTWETISPENVSLSEVCDVPEDSEEHWAHDDHDEAHDQEQAQGEGETGRTDDPDQLLAPDSTTERESYWHGHDWGVGGGTDRQRTQCWETSGGSLEPHRNLYPDHSSLASCQSIANVQISNTYCSTQPDFNPSSEIALGSLVCLWWSVTLLLHSFQVNFLNSNNLTWCSSTQSNQSNYWGIDEANEAKGIMRQMRQMR